MSFDWISFTTDYGNDDGFVAACEGVIARISPGPRVLHVSHTVPAQDVRRGGAILAQIAPYLPPAVHLAVVDPGVGTERRGVVLVAAEGLLVGPDNGLLIPAAEALGGVRAAYLLSEPAYQLSRVSATFHGRDIFAPAAAHLAAGIAPENFGAAVDVDTLIRLPDPETVAEQGKLSTEILSIDSFGNIQLAATGADLDVAGARPGATAHVNLGGRSVNAAVARTFGDAGPDGVIVYVDSAGRVALAVNGGSAAADFDATLGDQVLLLFARS
jgi:S-adenosyl-L-methionine hydrolase (adenosine-forming)